MIFIVSSYSIQILMNVLKIEMAVLRCVQMK